MNGSERFSIDEKRRVAHSIGRSPWATRTTMARRPVRSASIAGCILLLWVLYVNTWCFSPILPALTNSRSSKWDSNVAQAMQNVPGSDFAYVLYVTNVEYLCTTILMLESLHRVKVTADRLLMYPEPWTQRDQAGTYIGTLLTQAHEYGALLQPVTIQHSGEGGTWQDSFTKLLAFNQTQYKRVLSLDSDATVLRSMDELFLLPSSPVAAPRAYWLADDALSSQLMLIEPSTAGFKRVLDQISHHKDGDFDMEILNNLYRSTAAVIPHRPYSLVSGEFRSNNHVKYSGDQDSAWNGTQILEEAKFVHFSDWPMSKPWKASFTDLGKAKPACRESAVDGSDDCSDQSAWLWLYRDFARRKEEICDAAVG